MMRSLRSLLLLAVLLGAGAADARAQTELCSLLEDPTREFTITGRDTPYETWYATRAVFVCPGGRRLLADAATFHRVSGLITLDGNVHVEDAERTLRAGFAQYFTETRQIAAHTNAVVSDRTSGSTISGHRIDIHQQSPAQPDGMIWAREGSPRAVMIRQRADGTGTETTTLDAQDIRIVGESFRGTGSARMQRDSLIATGQTIEYARTTGRMDIAGTARVELPAYQLAGDSIGATVGADEQLEDVLARHDAVLQTEDLRVSAPGIRLLFADGGVNRLVAMQWQPRAGREPGARPLVVSEEFMMRADSIDVLAPEQQLTEAAAFGNAHGERIRPDTINALMPETSPDVAALIATDWMSGDTVRARFGPNPRAETDTTAAARVMEQLSAYGEQAQSMYGMRDDNRPGERLSFNYLAAAHIEINFADGTVSTVNAAGDARGIYIQPAEAARAAGGTGSPRR